MKLDSNSPLPGTPLDSPPLSRVQSGPSTVVYSFASPIPASPRSLSSRALSPSSPFLPPPAPEHAHGAPHHKGASFWLTFVALLVALFLSALDLSAIPTALPTIAADLSGADRFVWVGSAYGLASAAVLPLIGRLADRFGRRPVMLTAIALFSLGSALAGAAVNMNMLIASRTVQGIGGGAIYTLAQIITSDLVPLAERGAYQGLLVMAYAFAAGIGPVVGGALASHGAWRWLFYMNLPLTGLAFTLVLLFLRVRVQKSSVGTKLSHMDWFGNALIAAGSTLTLIALTWGGIHYPWTSAHVLAPLITGVCLMISYVVYEIKFARDPTLPVDILSNRTTVSAYLATFCHGITSISVIYYMPTYFQACMGASPMRSSVQTLPIALTLAPFALAGGLTVKLSQTYRPVNLIGWVIGVAGFAVLSTLKSDTPLARWVGFQFLVAAGIGVNFTATVFPVLAPLDVSRSAAALAFFSFCRTFAQTWGITIAATILQNQLNSRLPAAFAAQFPAGVEIAYSAVPVIKTLEEPLRSEVRDAFAESLATIWKVMIGVNGLGLLSVFLLKEVPMANYKDDTYGLVDDDTDTIVGSADPEKGTSAH